MAEEANPQSTRLADALMARRTVVLSGDITRGSTADVGRRIIELQTRSTDQITLIIDSGGGNIDAAFDICDLISVVITAPVRGIALGMCGSAATFIMLHCTNRIGAPNSRFVIHSGSITAPKLSIDKDLEENLKHLAEEARSAQERIIRMYMDRLTPKHWTQKRPEEEERRSFVEKLIKRGDRRFNDELQASEALEIGLIQRITSEKIDIFPV